MFNLCRRASFESLYLGVEVLALISLVGMGGGGMAKHSWCLPGKQWWERKCKDPGFTALCDRCEETKWKVGVLVGGGGSTLAHVRLFGVLSSFLLPCLRKPACVEKGSILAYSFRGSSPSSIVPFNLDLSWHMTTFNAWWNKLLHSRPRKKGGDWALAFTRAPFQRPKDHPLGATFFLINIYSLYTMMGFIMIVITHIYYVLRSYSYPISFLCPLSHWPSFL